MKNQSKVTTKMTCLLIWSDKGFQGGKIEHMKQKRKNNLFGKGMKLYKEKKRQWNQNYFFEELFKNPKMYMEQQ